MMMTVMMAALFAAVSVDANLPARHVFSMSCKVTSCNSELATPAGRERAVAWFRTNHITKLWLESYRHTESVPTERLIEERDAFRKAGFTVCGMITPTQLNAPGKDGKRPMVVCWSDPEARARLRAEAVRAAGIFETVILDDFLFSNCDDGCARCKADKARRGIADWGAYRRALLYEVCERDVLAAARAANPKAHFIIKYPCWYRHHAQNGYDVVLETKLFGECWIGTETRDANPQPLQACWIMDRFDRLTEGHCGGGWYDGLDSSPEKFVEQAYYTILGGARESLVHCYDYLVADDPGVTPFGEKATRGHACAAAFTREIDRLQELGDFLCGAERLGYVRGADGVSRHRFRKNGRTYLARLNTTDRESDGLPPHGFDIRDEAKVPLALHPIFQDGLTFAANRPIRVYGSGAGRVEVEFCGKKSEGRPTADGWLAELPAVPAGGPYVLRVTLDGSAREIRGVTVGEVWLMSGQSNMKDKVAKKPFEPIGGVRVYSAQSVERGERFSPKDGWVAVTKESAPELSALACHFGCERRAKGVEHVGLVSCAQGASIIESWLPASVTRTPTFNLAPEDLNPDHDAAPYLDWNAPGGLYDFGFRTLGPFAFTGVVWYQGESDTTVAEAAVYPDLLKTMVGAWRRDLRDAELPFYVIQIADFDGRKDAGWRSLQDAQAKAAAQIPGVTLVRSADICATDDIHPSGKDCLARRLSEQPPSPFVSNAASAEVRSESRGARLPKPLLKIAVMSDIQGYPYPEDAGMRHLERALDVLAPFRPDVVVNDGDINDRGVDADAVRYYKARCDVRLGRIPHVCCAGNHEIGFVPDELKAKRTPSVCVADFNAVFGEGPSPLVAKTIGGCDFIALGLRSEAGYSAEDLALLKDALDRAVRRDALKPIFVVTHYHPFDTVRCGDDASVGGALRKLLNGYPQVVNLSGHTHNPLQDPRSIWQGEFTVVETSTLCYGCIDERPPQENQISCLIPYGHEAVGCLLLEVYADRLVLRRFRVRDRQEIEPENPWSFSLPYDPKRPKYDVAARAASERPPQLPKDAEPTLWYDFGFVYLMFAAAADPSAVFSYRIELTDRTGTAKSYAVLSDFYRIPAHRQDRVVFRLPPKAVEPGGHYRCRIFPVGFFGKEGRPCEWAFDVNASYPATTQKANCLQE